MSADSTRPRRSRKAALNRPEKPYPDFPLCAHANGRWQKKIRGKIYYFGKWGRIVKGNMERLPEDGWQDALSEYKESLEAILRTGQKPSPEEERELTVADLCNRFWAAKKKQLEAGEITPRTFAEYKLTTDRLVATFGKNRLVDDLAADDFELLRAGMAKQWGPYRLGNEVQKVRTVFKYGYEAGLIDRPVRFGPQFKKPPARVIRKHRAKQPKKMLEADELRNLIDSAPAQLKAMILLGLNCGLGNNDCAMLPLSRLDLDSGWIDFPRPKTGIERRCPLWPETIEALREAIAERPTPKTEEAKDHVFVTSRGRPWLSRGIANPVSVAARDLMKTSKVKRPGIGFYTLRHVFQTIGDEARDPVAIARIMGHADGSMAGVNRERIDDSRLQAVTDHVRAWLWPKPTKADKPERTTKAKRERKPSKASESKAAKDDRPTLKLYAG